MAAVILACALAPRAGAAEATPSFHGKIAHDEDLSAVAAVGRFLVVASDEGCAVQLLEPEGDADRYRVRGEPIRLQPCTGEVDIEGLAYSEGLLYVLGSHSLKRRLVDPDAGPRENRERLAAVSPEPERQHLFRLGLDAASGRPAAAVEAISLRPLLEADPLLGPFARVPATENGVNLEGLAADGETLYLGFRGPVLREGHVPVMVLRFDEPERYELRFLLLGGAGVRSLARVEDGLLVLARREHGTPHGDAVYLWDGRDMLVPGAGAAASLQRLIELSPPDGGTPEGLAVLARHPDHYDAIVVHDGPSGGRPLRLRIPRPGRPHSSR